MANGETVPSSVTGMANSTSTEANEPSTTPASMLITALAAACRIGRATNGIKRAQECAPQQNAVERLQVR